MPRTQLHSAASGPARTAFHANRGVSVDELQVELAQANEVVTTKIEVAKEEIKVDTGILKVDTGILKVDTGVLKVDTRILKRRTRPTDVIADEEVEDILPGPVIGRTALTPEQQQQAFLCMLALNRAESLAIDTSQGAARNNRTLRQIRNDRLIRSSLKTLPDVFQESVQAIHNNFPTSPEDEAKERLERFWMIQNLRRAIMAHFAAQSLVAPSSTTVADAPATQDTQS